MPTLKVAACATDGDRMEVAAAKQLLIQATIMPPILLLQNI